MKKLLVYMKGYTKDCIIAPLLKLFEATLELFVPFVMAIIIDEGIGNSDKKTVIMMSLLLVLIALFGLLGAISAQYFAARAAIGFSTVLRHKLMEKIQRLSYSDIDQLGNSALLTCMTSDTGRVQTGVNLTLRLLLRSPFIVFGAMAAAYFIDVRSGIIFTCVIAVLSIVVFGIMLVTVPMHKKTQNILDSVTLSTRENLLGARVIRAFGAEEKERATFDERNSSLNQSQRKAGRISALLNPLTLVIINIAIVILLYAGALRVESGSLSQGKVVALYNYMSLILVELVKLANLIITITKSLASAQRIEDILEIPEDEYEKGSIIPEKKGTVEFENVSVRYNNAGEDALFNISFSAKRGDRIGIIGGTGSGKSTLVNLIPKFYQASEGRILVDGVDLCDYKTEELRKRIGIVPQKASLFKGTVRSNLLIGNENASDGELIKALEIAQGLDIIESKNGLDTEISQNGNNLSGGQKQRLTIARALVKRPEILIFDDSSSALDYSTAAKLEKGLENLDYSPTVFTVSQRVSSVESSDLIIVLEDGKEVGKGKHGDLIKNCEIYKEIYNSGVGGEEE